MRILLILLLLTTNVFADSRTDTPSPLFGDVDGTNAGRYRSVKFTNGTTTNNGDGSVTVATGGGSGTPGGSDTQVQYNSAGSFAGSNNFVFDGTNVGIGTTLPSGKLHLSSTDTYLYLSDTDASVGGKNFAFRSSAGRLGFFSADDAFAVTERMNIRASGGISIGSTYTSSDAGANNLIIEGNVGIGSLTPNGKLNIVQATAVDAFRVDDASGDTSPFIITSAGTVGIGTHTPTTKLSITPESGVGDGLFISRAGSGDTAGGYWRVALRNSANSDSMNLAQSSSNYATGGAFAWVGNSEGFLYYPTTFKIGTGVAGSPAMYFNNNGNIGIGTLTNPTAKLAIESTAAQDLFRVSDDGAGDTSPFTITSAGNVGIGTTSPPRPLSVYASTPVVQITNSTAGGTANDGLLFTQSVLDSIIENSEAGSLYLRTTATNRVRIDAGGNVGIGTISVDAKLNVLNTAAIDSFRVDDAAGDTSPFIIDSVGNVGIGTSLPDAPLSIGQRRFRVDANGRVRLAGNTSVATVSAHVDFSNATSFSSASNVYGMLGEVTNSSTGNSYGYNTTAASSVTGTVNEIIGMRSTVRTIAAGTNATLGADFYAVSPAITAGTIASQYGLYIADQEPAGVTKGYGIYQVDVDNDNYFAGNVGIGTALPQPTLAGRKALEITDTVSGAELILTGPSSVRGAMKATSSVVTFGSLSSNGLQIQTNNTGRVFVNGADGNVGIGSLTPAAVLDVTGEIRASTGTAGQAVCWKADKTLGQCTTVVDVTGGCTCS